MSLNTDQKRLHSDLNNIGLRAQATAAGLVQLCRELQLAGILQEDALTRIKSAIADEVVINAPRSLKGDEYRRYIGRRLDAMFSGHSKVGSADQLAPPEETAD